MNSTNSPRARPLNRSTPVPRELVHRTALAEVLLTDVRASGDQAGNSFEAAAQWARSHPTFDRTGDGRHDPLMVAETLRQLGIYVPLRYYAVPPDSHFLIEELNYSLDPALEPRATFAGSEITCEIQAEPLQSDRQGHLQRLHLAVRYLTDGSMFAQAEGIARFLSATAYAAVRSRQPADDPTEHTPVIAPDPLLVGATREQDLLIAVDPHGSVRLTPADGYHPFFFDHFSDHVPGMVLIEAARQAAALHLEDPNVRTTACVLRAARFTEPSPPAHITCDFTPTECKFEIWQLGNQTASGSLGFEGNCDRFKRSCGKVSSG